MKKVILIIFALLFSANIAAAFEVNGLKSGMTPDQARVVLERQWWGAIDEQGNRIVAYPKLTHDPLIVLNFKKGRLYRYQKRCYPEFSHFTQLIADKRMELGKPVDAWLEPTIAASTNDIKCMEFLWKNGKYTCRISYAQNDPDSWMTITYEDKI